MAMALCLLLQERLIHGFLFLVEYLADLGADLRLQRLESWIGLAPERRDLLVVTLHDGLYLCLLLGGQGELRRQPTKITLPAISGAIALTFSVVTSALSFSGLRLADKRAVQRGAGNAAE